MRHPFVEYHQRILELNPIAYWPLDEKSGTVAYGWVSGRNLGEQNGTHTAVTLGQPGIGDGRTSASYDGATSYTNVYTATLAAALNGAEGSLLIWAKVSAAGAWTDGVRREAFRAIDTTDNREYVWVAKDSTNNQWWFRRSGNNVIEDVRVASGAPLGWTCLALTWSEAADQVKAFVAGVQTGATQTGLGAWAGDIEVAAIGASDLVPNNPWSGTLAHCALWNRALSAAEIAALAVVE